MLYLVVSLTCLSAVPSPNSIVKKIESYYKNITDLKASFTNSYRQKIRNKPKHENGILYIKRPKQLRMDYHKPHRKYFVFDGETAYFYIVEDVQVIRDKGLFL